LGRVEEGTRITMEVDSIVVEVATKSIQVGPYTIEAATKVHPSTLVTILEIKEVTKNLQEDETGIAPMVK
jgi:hypothetical protein